MKRLIIVIFIAAMAAGFGVWHFSSDHAHKGTPYERQTTNDERQIYHCPMHPTYTSDRPGECPICGMTLVPIERAGEREMHADEKVEDRASITIDPVRQQLIGLKTAPVERKTAVKIIRTVGRVAFDPELAVAEREYVEAKRLGDDSLAAAAHDRLTLMGLSGEQIKEIGRKRKVESNLYLVEQGKTAWIYPIIYESELPYVKTGQTVDVTLPNIQETALSGVIRAIDPVLDPATRSARVRVEVENKDGLLKPNIFVNAAIKIDLGEKLTVPKSAIIDTGTRKIAFLSHAGGRLAPREVVTGAELEDDFVVESGLSEGDVVVASANFLIDSESQLRGAIEKMTGGHKHY